MGRLGPGPGAYRLPTTVGFPGHDPSRFRNPMFSFGGRPEGPGGGQRAKGLGPGAGAYRIAGVTRDGAVGAPAWSFGGRMATRAPVRTPGPGAHAPERCPPMREQRAPAYSMGARLAMMGGRRQGPAPNAYALRSKGHAPAWSMAARLGVQGKRASPGPAAYFQRDHNVTCPRAPVYSLAGRLEGGKLSKASPGPAAYPPHLYNTKKNPYAFSFGTKHGEAAPPLIIKEDTMDCL